MDTTSNTTQVGDEFEMRIFELFETEIGAGRFPFRKDCCKLFAKKGYYSRDRCSKIIFDIAIEVYFPGADEYSMLLLVECKRYAKSVPVDDIEEFFSKVQQVGAANTKAIVVSTAAFQSGAREYASAKKIGLARYFGPENFKWELRRSPSTVARTHSEARRSVEQGLSDQSFKSTSFDFFFQAPNLLTNSLWEFFEDTSFAADPVNALQRAVMNVPQDSEDVQFLSKETIEEMSASALSRISYAGGEVQLDTLCAQETERSGLQLKLNSPSLEGGPGVHTLGRITFDPLEIEIFAQATPNRGRERFTLAHEISHFLLDHGRYLTRESCDDDDFVLQSVNLDHSSVARLEYQANYMASSILLPRTNVESDFRQLLRMLDLPDKGFGPLYVDDQPCNIRNYDFVTGRLMEKYGVSRSAVRIRLETLELLHYGRPRS